MKESSSKSDLQTKQNKTKPNNYNTGIKGLWKVYMRNALGEAVTSPSWEDTEGFMKEISGVLKDEIQQCTDMFFVLKYV